MIEKELWVAMKNLYNQGLSKSEISRRLNIDRKNSNIEFKKGSSSPIRS